ncbi:MAG: hypothetical protein LM590_03575 [Thermofilum sp.]|jgi:hypothetical protein|nr:hypothetical protein [Thermofilum sp.]
MLLIVSAWVISLDTVPSLRLSLLYGLGSLFLTLHSYVISDAVFLVLNVLSSLISMFNVYRALKRKRLAGRR